MNYRIFVEKRPEFQVEAKSLRNELNNNLNLKISTLRLINVYDLFGFTEDLLKKSRFQVFGDIVTDTVSDAIDLTAKKYVAVEYLPGQIFYSHIFFCSQVNGVAHSIGYNVTENLKTAFFKQILCKTKQVVHVY